MEGTNTGEEKTDSNSTYKQYERVFENYMDKVAADFGIVDITEIKHEHFMKYVNEAVIQWQKGSVGVSHQIKQLRAAVESFRIGTIKTNVFNKEIQVIDKNEVKKTLDYNHVKRMSTASHTLSLGIEESKMVESKIIESRSKHKKEALKAWKISTMTGGRLADVVDKLSPSNIDFHSKQITFETSKGGLTETVKLSDEETSYLKEICEGLNPKQNIIQVKKDNGKPMKKVNQMATIRRIIATAGEIARLNRDENLRYKYRDNDGNSVWGTTTIHKTVSHHGARKVFINTRFDKYCDMSEQQREQELHARLQNLKVKAKFDKELDKIVRDEMYRYEVAIFLTSLDARHYRKDVITAWYLDSLRVEAQKRIDLG